MSHWTTTTARTVIYFCSIGGLLVLNSLVVVVLWNEVFRDNASSSPELSFLEGAGLTAFAYVIVFSVRYGIQSARAAAAGLHAEECAREEIQRRHSERLSRLSPEQRTALKSELLQNCGCKENPVK